MELLKKDSAKELGAVLVDVLWVEVHQLSGKDGLGIDNPCLVVLVDLVGLPLTSQDQDLRIEKLGQL